MIVQTTDERLLTRILKDPGVFDVVFEDGYMPEDYSFRLQDGVIALLAMDGDTVEGAFFLYPQSKVVYELHTALLVKGKKAKQHGLDMFAWMWENTNAHRIITSIPSYNNGAKAMASLCGMVRYGENECSWLKYNQLHTIFLYGLTRR